MSNFVYGISLRINGYIHLIIVMTMGWHDIYESGLVWTCFFPFDSVYITCKPSGLKVWIYTWIIQDTSLTFFRFNYNSIVDTIAWQTTATRTRRVAPSLHLNLWEYHSLILVLQGVRRNCFHFVFCWFHSFLSTYSKQFGHFWYAQLM